MGKGTEGIKKSHNMLPGVTFSTIELLKLRDSKLCRIRFHNHFDENGGSKSRETKDIEAFSFSCLNSDSASDRAIKDVGFTITLAGHLPRAARLSTFVNVVFCIGLWVIARQLV